MSLVHVTPHTTHHAHTHVSPPGLTSTAIHTTSPQRLHTGHAHTTRTPRCTTPSCTTLPLHSRAPQTQACAFCLADFPYCRGFRTSCAVYSRGLCSEAPDEALFLSVWRSLPPSLWAERRPRRRLPSLQNRAGIHTRVRSHLRTLFLSVSRALHW
jgi:hypothetical protein